jgi:uncharacterized protein
MNINNINYSNKAGDNLLKIERSELIAQHVKNNNLEALKNILKFPDDLEAKWGPEQEPLLLMAVRLNRREMVEFLLKEGIKKKTDLDVKNNQGITPLMSACHEKNFELFNLLLKAGANPDLKNVDRHSALTIAISKEATEIVRALANNQGKLGSTPLMRWTKQRSSPKMIQILLENGVDTKIKDDRGYQFIHYALLEQSLGYHGLDDVITTYLKNQTLPDLPALFIEQKLLGLRFGEKTKWEVDGKTYNIEGFSRQVSYRALQESLEKFIEHKNAQAQSPLSELSKNLISILPPSFSFETYDWSAVHQSISSYLVKEEDIEPAVKKDVPFNMFSVPAGGLLHATSLIFIKIKEDDVDQFYIVKGNRGGGALEGKPGLRFYKVGDPSKLVPTLKKGLSEMKSDPGTFFYKTLNDELKLTEVPENYIVTHPQTVGNCSWAAAKLTLRGMLYWHLRAEGKDHPVAVQLSRTLYKEWSAYDRKQSLDHYIQKIHHLEKEAARLGITMESLEREGIIPNKILTDILYKAIRKSRLETVQKLVTEFPHLLKLQSPPGLGLSLVGMARYFHSPHIEHYLVNLGCPPVTSDESKKIQTLYSTRKRKKG